MAGHMDYRNIETRKPLFVEILANREEMKLFCLCSLPLCWAVGIRDLKTGSFRLAVQCLVVGWLVRWTFSGDR